MEQRQRPRRERGSRSRDRPLPKARLIGGDVPSGGRPPAVGHAGRKRLALAR